MVIAVVVAVAVAAAAVELVGQGNFFFSPFRLSKLGSHALLAADTHPMDGRAPRWYWAGAAFRLIAVKRFGGSLWTANT